MIHAPVEPDLSRPVLRQNEPSTIFLALGEFRAKRTNSASWWNSRASSHDWHQPRSQRTCGI